MQRAFLLNLDLRKANGCICGTRVNNAMIQTNEVVVRINPLQRQVSCIIKGIEEQEIHFINFILVWTWLIFEHKIRYCKRLSCKLETKLL